MPGRFAIISPPEILRAFFGYIEEPDFPPRHNIVPTQPIPIVTASAHARGERRHFTLMRWGFLPSFVKDPQTFALIANARAETLIERVSFKAAVKRRRCFVIADGFYERLPGRDRARAARSFLIRRRDGGPMGFAGLYETWCDPTGGEIDTACIVTTPPNELIAPICGRMPAIIERCDFSVWLDNDGVEAPQATALLRAAPEDALEIVEVGMDGSLSAEDDAATSPPLPPPN
jgi:putative SOS response-associated peptidase YedK